MNPAHAVGHAVPAVSVVMNIRNGAPYLRESIESVLAQSVTDFEVICFDDMSTDDSPAIVQSYSDPRIMFIRAERDLTLGKARDAAIAHARAPWLAFCDQDDIWLPHKLETQLPLTADAHVGLVYGRSVMHRDGLDIRDADHRHEFCTLPTGAILHELVRDSCYISMCSAMLRTSAVRALGPIPEIIDVSPDYWYYLGVCRTLKAAATEQVICRYRVHPGNMTKATGVKIHTEVLWMLEHLQNSVPQRTLMRRKRVHETLVAVHSMRAQGERLPGVLRLLRSGSLAYLLTRPFARAMRTCMRLVKRPRWRRAPVELKRVRSHPDVPILGTHVSALRFEDAVSCVAKLVEQQRARYVCAANAYALTLAERDAAHQAIVNRAALVTADGMPLVWYQKAMGLDAQRVHNDDLVLACFERFPDWKHYLVGGREGQAEAAAEALRSRFPTARIVGVDATPVRPVPPERTDAIVGRIRASEADVVWVGMGTPAQDFWMHDACTAAGVPMVGCGSLFDLVSGRTRRVPALVQNMGMQWLFRLAQEPRRLARRYLVHNTLFVAGLCKQVLFEKPPGRDG